MAVSWIALAVSVASTTYSLIKAKQQKDAAKKAADAKRGYEMPIEGESSNLAIVYGKSKIGGVRVYHASSGDYKYIASNAQKTFNTGNSNISINSYEFRPAGRTSQAVIAGASYLNQSYEGKKNEMLFIQQALCQAPIGAIYDVIVDESRMLDDYTLGTDFYINEINKIEAALRLDCHYSGGEHDAIMAANYNERKNAKFFDMTYVSAFVRLDRRNPQFSSTPILQFLIEGKRIRSIIRTGAGTLGDPYQYSLGLVYTYSNNSALVLLDYLLDNVSGKALLVDEIDLESFYKASIVCSKIVQTDVVVAGNIFRPIDGTRNVKLRDLPLYECNLLLDTKKSIRDNVETILSSMGDARLVWSSGKYKLQLFYPESEIETAALVSEVLDDSNIVLDQDIEIGWPSASDRFNHCVIRFSNEHENFKEDSVAWPPKVGMTTSNYKNVDALFSKDIYYGVGGIRYTPGIFLNDPSEKSGGRLLNNCAVWAGNGPECELDYKFILDRENLSVNGSNEEKLKIEFTGDDKIEWALWQINSLEPYSESLIHAEPLQYNWKKVFTRELTIPQNPDITKPGMFRLWVYGMDTSGEDDESKVTAGRGVALRILKGNLILWNTRETAYDRIVKKHVSNELYQQWLEEDNGLELETEIFAEGITDPYHALAKAEELARTSRGTFTLKLKYRVENGLLEPGDIVQVASETLKIGNDTPAYFKVNSVQLDENFESLLELTRFHYSFLAWNVKDDESNTVSPVFDSYIPAPMYLTYTQDVTNASTISSGRLDWPPVDVPKFECYIVYTFTLRDWDEGKFDEDGSPNFTEIGRTSSNFFILPNINSTDAFFAVKTKTTDGTSSYVFANVSYDSVEDKIVIPTVELIRPWLDADGNLVFDPSGKVGETAYLTIGENNILLSEIAQNSITPSLNFVGEFSTPPDEFTLGANWKQNSVYKNTVDGNSYVLTGTPLNWLLYLEGANNWYLTIESTNGTVFRPGQASTTILIGRVFKNGAEVTDLVSSSWFRWRRVSGIPQPPPNDDVTWNSGHVVGFKTINLNVDDVYARATFYLEIVSI